MLVTEKCHKNLNYDTAVKEKKKKTKKETNNHSAVNTVKETECQ